MSAQVLIWTCLLSRGVDFCTAHHWQSKITNTASGGCRNYCCYDSLVRSSTSHHELCRYTCAHTVKKHQAEVGGSRFEQFEMLRSCLDRWILPDVYRILPANFGNGLHLRSGFLLKMAIWGVDPHRPTTTALPHHRYSRTENPSEFLVIYTCICTYAMY